MGDCVSSQVIGVELPHSVVFETVGGVVRVRPGFDLNLGPAHIHVFMEQADWTENEQVAIAGVAFFNFCDPNDITSFHECDKIGSLMSERELGQLLAARGITPVPDTYGLHTVTVTCA